MSEKSKYPVPAGFHQHAVENVRRAIGIDGEKYASYFAHGYARYLPVSAGQILAEAKCMDPTIGGCDG